MSNVYSEHILRQARKSQSYARMQLEMWCRERARCAKPGCPGCVELSATIRELTMLVEPEDRQERYP